jgi:phage repressor protein C with HTH and peptisase S24 domain
MSSPETIGDRIREVRGRMSRDSFADLFGLKKGSIQRYELHGAAPPGDFITSLCESYKLNANWLLFGEGNKNKFSAEKNTYHSDICAVPMVSAILSAGDGSFVESENIDGYYYFKKEWVIRVSSNIKNCYLMMVYGGSMEDTIKNRDVVMIDVGKKKIIDGEIFALRIHDTVMIKRLLFRGSSRVLIVSDNKAEYPPYEESLADVNVLGQLVWFCRQLATH